MSVGYRLISWTPYKKRYDLFLVAIIATYLLTFYAVGKLLWRGEHSISDEILIIRALGTSAFAMLNVAICIGPLARLDRRFLPLLYNRRHLGVATFFVGFAHAVLALGFYHGFGRIAPVVSLVTSNTQYRSVSAFPFEALGLIALVILFVMAVTSHDFWLHHLTAKVWKTLHMFVYLAWALLVLHIALGALQSERNPVYAVLLGILVVTVATLHFVAGRREVKSDQVNRPVEQGWTDVCGVSEIPDGRAKVVTMRGRERAAVFRYGDRISAVSNVCAHQAGPLGEGRIIDGCITCPWHGYQYRPEDGCAPPPFTEKLPIYRIKVEGGRVMLQADPLPPGTATEPAIITEAAHA